MPHVQTYNDWPKPGVNFVDIFSATSKPEIMELLQQYMIEALKDVDFTHIVGLESRGFIIGTPLAMHFKKPFVPIRKKGKLPGELYRKEYSLEYGTDIVEI